jgi:hypothetical protein
MVCKCLFNFGGVLDLCLGPGSLLTNVVIRRCTNRPRTGCEV